MIADAVKTGVDLDPNEPGGMVLVSLFQPVERLVFLSETDVDQRYVVRRNVPALREILQPHERFLRFASFSRHRIGMSERSDRSRVASRKPGPLSILGDSLFIHRFLLVSHPKVPVCRSEVRITLIERLSELLDRLVVTASPKERSSDVRVDDQRERVALLRAFYFAHRLFHPPHRPSSRAAPLVLPRVARFG